jgi:alpha-tubulin suppressor-like RCC1 family protein
LEKLYLLKNSVMKKIVLIIMIFSFCESIHGQCWTSTSASIYTTFAIKSDGTLWGCGGNFNGQLGDGTTIDRNSFIQIGNDSDWKIVLAGESHTLAIKLDGTLWAWGYNNYGELGDGTNVDKLNPIQVGTDNDWKDISATYWSNLALKNDGSLWAWGFNLDFGQLGDGTNINKFIPTQIGTDTDWSKISAGAAHSLAIKTNGTLWAWGRNAEGQFGNGNNVDSYIPIQIGQDANWKQAIAGQYHTLALKNNGTLFSSGNNDYGALGLVVNSGEEFILKQIGTENDWESISVGTNNSLAIKNNKTLWISGYNLYGMLGDGTTNQHDTFQQVGNNTNWEYATTGEYHTVGLLSDGTFLTWGHNFYGQLGNGLNLDSLTPIHVDCNRNQQNSSITRSYLIYPNPAHTTLKISFSEAKEIQKLVIMDMCGKVVLEQDGDIAQINVENISNGLYIIKIITNTEIFNEQFLKE